MTIKKFFLHPQDKIPGDPFFEKFQSSLEENYQKDPLLPVFGGAKRPPIRNIVVIYGIDVETEIGYVYSYGERRDYIGRLVGWS